MNNMRNKNIERCLFDYLGVVLICWIYNIIAFVFKINHITFLLATLIIVIGCFVGNIIYDTIFIKE